jgi:hypothetical protein
MQHNLVDSTSSTCYKCSMAILSVRGVEPELMQTVKSCAALRGMSLREWVIQALTNASVDTLQGEIGRRPKNRETVVDSTESVTAPVAPPVRGRGQAVRLRSPGDGDKVESAKPTRKVRLCAHGVMLGLRCFPCGGEAK